MEIYMNETVSPPPLPPPHPTNQTTQTVAMSVCNPSNSEQFKFKMSCTKWIYTLCFFAFATTATVSLIFAISAYRSNENQLYQISKLQKATSHFQATEKKIEELNLQTKLNEGLITFGTKNCYDLANLGVQTSGVYNIIVAKNIIDVYCDMETDGGGWTVLQRRISNDTDFYRGWFSYVVGFGNLTGNFWLGLEIIHAMTSSQSYQLRVDLEDFSGNRAYALYSSFSVGSNSTNYLLHVGGYDERSNAGDSLNTQSKRPFTTKDRDNDAHGSVNCAEVYHGAWWYNKCHNSNLNGKYYSSGVAKGDSIIWWNWKNKNFSLKKVEMKIKPRSAKL